MQTIFLFPTCLKNSVALKHGLAISVPGENQCAHSLEVTQTTEAAMGEARIHCQLVAALQMRAEAAQDPIVRQVLRNDLEKLLKEAQARTVLHVEAEAWDLERPLGQVPKSQKLGEPTLSRRQQAKQKEELGKVEVARVEQHDIRLEAAAPTERPTSFQSLRQQVTEKNHTSLAKGTKRALLCGGGAFNARMRSLRWKPKLQLSGGSWYLRALAEPSDCLGVSWLLIRTERKSNPVKTKNQEVETMKGTVRDNRKFMRLRDPPATPQQKTRLCPGQGVLCHCQRQEHCGACRRVARTDHTSFRHRGMASKALASAPMGNSQQLPCVLNPGPWSHSAGRRRLRRR